MENSVQDCLSYILIPNGLCELFLAYPNDHVYHTLYDIISSKIFYILPWIIWFVTVLSDVTCCVTAWSCHSNPISSSKNRIKGSNLKRK